jgi:D-serine deaminase-like pyridoxal phosphate-dependent protein
LPLSKHDLPTPALIADLDALERSLARMADAVRASGKQLRPHGKAHKCPDIARRQITAGACGLCVATVAEAELFSHAGISGLLLTTPLADLRKMQRVAATGATAVVDNSHQVQWYAAIQAPIDLLIDLDPGDHRTGAATLEQALEIAEAIDRAPNLTLRGLQAYSVSGSHGPNETERRRLSTETFKFAAAVRDRLAERGIETRIVSGGSTGTWSVDLALPHITELQAGSYPLMDLAYRRIGIDFENSMRVLATVISANHADFVTVDAGFKAFSTDRPFGPEPAALPGASYRWGGDEHGYLDIRESAIKPKLGDKIEFLPPHCDPTVNLHRAIYACRGVHVEEIWPVMGRTPEISNA